MPEFEPSDIDSVAIEPNYCHRCGGELGTNEWEGREHPWCSECEVLFSQNPVAGAHVVVHDDDHVLLLDEDIPQHEELWSLPGGFARYDDGPAETAVRELEEEAGLRADPDDLSFLNIIHAEFPHLGLYLIGYEVDRSKVSGELTPEFEGFEAAYVPIEEIRESTDRIRESDLERIEMALKR